MSGTKKPSHTVQLREMTAERDDLLGEVESLRGVIKALERDLERREAINAKRMIKDRDETIKRMDLTREHHTGRIEGLECALTILAKELR